VLAAAVAAAPFFGGDVKASLSVPSFYDHFDRETKTLKEGDVKMQLIAAMEAL
jgi:chromate reductase, NAD(P)H dehydrogenase (quinone)